MQITVHGKEEGFVKAWRLQLRYFQRGIKSTAKTPCPLSWWEPQESELVEGGGMCVCKMGVCVAGTETTEK